MAFIKMIYFRFQPKFLERSHASYPQHHFLGNALLRKPAVELSSCQRIRIVWQVCVQQIQRHIIIFDTLPHLAFNLPAPYPDFYSNRCILKKIVTIFRVAVANPPDFVYHLFCIALTPQDSYRNHRIILVFRRFKQISSQNPQSARIYPKIFMKSVFHAEIRYFRRF